MIAGVPLERSIASAGHSATSPLRTHDAAMDRAQLGMFSCSLISQYHATAFFQVVMVQG